jgi:hypothetical protein
MIEKYEVAAFLENRQGEVTQFSRIVGVDFGRPIKILAHQGQFAVAKREGHLTFDGIGRQRWAGSQYYLLQIWREDKKIDFEILERIEPGYHYQKAITKLKKEMNKLARGK